MFNWNNKKNSSPTTSTPSASSPTTYNQLSGLGPLGQTTAASTSSGNLNSYLNTTSNTTTNTSNSSNSNSTSNNQQSINSSLDGTNSLVNGNNGILFGQAINPNLDGGPAILNKFTKYLLAKTTPLEHIFKPHPEFENEVQSVKKNILKDLSLGDAEQIQLSTFTQNAHVIAEILKQYLFSLPEPLFTYNLYDSFLLTHSILTPADRIWAYRFLLLYLPIGFRGAIKNIFGLLHKIHLNCSSTKMDSVSLSSILSPVFLRPEEEMYYMKSDKLTIEEIVRLWIEEFETISKPPVGPNQKVSTILSSIAPTTTTTTAATINTSSNSPSSHPLDNQNPSSQQHGNHLTIGLNKIIQQQTQLTNATNPQQTPKLALPTIPKQQNSQQTTIIKVKPPLQALTQPQQKSTTNTPTTSKPPTPTPTTTTTTTPVATVTSPTPTSMITKSTPKSPVSPTTTTVTSPTIPPSLSTNNPTVPSHYTLLSTLDQDTTDKVNKIKLTVENLISEQILNNLKNVIRSIEKETNYNHTIKLSTILRDFKKNLQESSEKSLSITKNEVKSFISSNQKPPIFNISLSLPSPNSNHSEDEKRLLELKRASQTALEEISDYIYFYKIKLNQFNYKEQIIQTAQLFSKIKSIIDLQSTTVTTQDQQQQIGGVSPTTSPSTNRRQPLSPNSPQIKAIDSVSKEINERLNSMKKDLETSNLQDAVDIGKAIRSTKQTLLELFQENKYPLPLDTKVTTSPDQDQLTNLKMALEPLFERIFNQIDYVGRLINTTSNISDQEFNNINEKLLFINKVLSVTL